MPLQNRVMPDGKIIATAARGTLMGNRGILHNQDQQLVKLFSHKNWVSCPLAKITWSPQNVCFFEVLIIAIPRFFSTEITGQE